MPRYYLHVCNGHGFTEDEEGTELADESAARSLAIKSARAIMADELRFGELDLGAFIEVEDSSRQLLFTLMFKDAVTWKQSPEEQLPSRSRGRS